jgi:hypothetical protein
MESDSNYAKSERLDRLEQHQRQLKEKMRLLSIYKTHGDLGVWDWYDQQDPTNYMMKYVVAEGFKRIK